MFPEAVGNQAIAKNLKETASQLATPQFVEIGGVRVAFPYQEFGGQPYLSPYSPPVPKEALDCYLTLRDLFDPEKIQPDWAEAIQEAAAAREKAGSDSPISFLDGVYVVLQSHPRARELGIDQFPDIPNIGPDFRDREKVVGRVNAVLADKDLRAALLDILADLIPQEAIDQIPQKEVATFLKELGIQSGLIVDLGCGTGTKTKKWARLMEMPTLGLDRLYFETHFFEPWRSQSSGLWFAQADIRNIPLPENSVDVAIMDTVAIHMTEQALASALDEAMRVLKKDRGILIVGSQETAEPENEVGGELRYFVKVGGPGGQAILVSQNTQQLKERLARYYYGADDRLGPHFGHGTLTIDDPSLEGKTPEEQLAALAWSHGCPDPEKVGKEYGIDWIIRRYSQCNYWTGKILEQAVLLNPKLAESLASPVPRQPGETAGKHNPRAVPQSHLTHYSPTSTPAGYAAARILIVQFGQDEKWSEEREKRGLAILDEAVKSSSTPAEFLARLAEGVIKADADPTAVLSHVFSTVLGEEGGCSLVKEAAKEVQDKAPCLWAHYCSLPPYQKRQAGILNLLTAGGIAQEMRDQAAWVFRRQKHILESFRWSKEHPDQEQERIETFDRVIEELNQLIVQPVTTNSGNERADRLRWMIWPHKRLPTLEELGWQQLADDKVAAAIQRTYYQAGEKFPEWANRPFEKPAMAAASVLGEAYGALLEELWKDKQTTPGRLQRAFVLAFETILITRHQNSALLNDVIDWMREESGDFSEEVQELLGQI